MSESTCDLSKKSFPTTLVAMLNFCMKPKKFVSETERARTILEKKFYPQGICLLYPAEASGGYFGLAFAMPLPRVGRFLELALSEENYTS